VCLTGVRPLDIATIGETVIRLGDGMFISYRRVSTNWYESGATSGAVLKVSKHRLTQLITLMFNFSKNDDYANESILGVS
jgi:hypothetical protein